MSADGPQPPDDGASRRLAASEQRFRSLVHASADAVLLIHPDGDVEYLSPLAHLVMGGDGAAPMRDGGLVRNIHPDDRHAVITTFREAFAAGPGKRFTNTHRIKTADGGWIWVEVRLVNRVGVEGIDALVVSARDVTARELAVRRLRRRLHAEDVMARIAARFVDVLADELDDALDEMLAELGAFARVDRAWIFEVSTDRALVSNTHEWCAPGIASEIDALSGLPVAELPAFGGWLGAHDPFLIGSVDEMPDEWAAEREILADQGIRSIAGVGIFVAGELIGMMGLDAVTEERRFTDSDLWVLRSTADVCGAALRRCAAERELAASEERFRAMIHNATDGVRLVDRDLRTVFASPAVTTITGYSIEEISDPGVRTAFVHPDDRAMLERSRADALARPGETVHCTYRARHRDGHWIDIEEAMTNLLDDPAVRGVVANMRDVTAVRRHEAELMAQARRDPLTDLPNRRLFDELVDAALARIRRTGAQLALMYLDLDRFKLVNDSFGHHVGDALIVEAADRLRAAVRGGDVVARLSGDEFAVLCEPVDGETEALSIAGRILEAFREPFTIGHSTIYSTASVGIVLSDDGHDERAGLLRDADAAMYSAKSAGRNRSAVFSGTLVAIARERLEVEVGLRSAVPENQLQLLYQPIVHLPTGRITGAEALLRWHHPERGLLTPAAFLDVAEETGMIVPIGQWVLGEACRQLAAWDAAGHPADVDLHVNVSVRQLVEGGIASAAREALSASGVAAERLCIEITESALLAGDDATSELGAVHECGVRLALDDFGTGHSSLSYLRQLEVDVLKIDRSFIDGVGTDEHDTAIVSAIVRLAETLGLTAVGEGVEDEAQAQALRDLGCDQAQGFWCAPPLDAASYETLLRRQADGEPVVACGGLAPGQVPAVR
ncbi:sensor domain-containing protein [Actinomarinicola tropica]|uniref:EAL domain-containing protein n=1 Tax=Actinomarinicola tropica TaxID=2789776 RepID=A0A5Q2RLU0_9ACTN|nr:EAL domain-containing protein [Actinomarinicola tropica]QGG95047.1 EAL domain-containing protein [Actinomarinicola tropica]